MVLLSSETLAFLRLVLQSPSFLDYYHHHTGPRCIIADEDALYYTTFPWFRRCHFDSTSFSYAEIRATMNRSRSFSSSLEPEGYLVSLPSSICPPLKKAQFSPQFSVFNLLNLLHLISPSFCSPLGSSSFPTVYIFMPTSFDRSSSLHRCRHAFFDFDAYEST